MKPYPELQTIAERAKWARSQAHLTQDQVAKKCGKSRDWVSKIERGGTKMPRDIADLANALDVSPAWLMFGVEEIDALTEDSIRIALAWNALPVAQKQTIAALIESFRTPPEKK